MTETTAIERHRGSVAIEPEEYSKQRVELIRQTLMPRGNDAELELFVTYAQRTGLDPFRKQIYAIQVWNEEAKRYTYQFMVGIDGLRLVAVRTGEFEGQEGPHWKAKGGPWVDVWEEEGPPFAARVGVYRTGSRGPIWGLCRYDSFVRRNRKGEPMGIWKTAPDHQLSIRAESHALRKAFPAETAGLHVRYDEDAPARVVNPDSAITYPQLGEMHRLAKELGFSDQQRHELAGVESFKDLTKGQAHELIDTWREMLQGAAGDTQSNGQTSNGTAVTTVEATARVTSPDDAPAPDGPLDAPPEETPDDGVPAHQYTGDGENGCVACGFLPEHWSHSAKRSPSETNGAGPPADAEGEQDGEGGETGAEGAARPSGDESPPEPSDDPKVNKGSFEGYRFSACAKTEAGREWLRSHEAQTGPKARRELALAWVAFGETPRA